MMRRKYDQVLDAIDGLVPSHWEKRVRERTLNLVMADWVAEVAEAGMLPIPPAARIHAEKIAEITRRFNDRDWQDGLSSTSRAREILELLRTDGLLPPND